MSSATSAVGGGAKALFSAKWYTRMHEAVRPMNESKVFAGLVVVLLNLSMKHVDVGLSKSMQSYFKNSFSRQALVFAMVWMPTRDVLAALIVSTLAILVIDCLANDESAFCILPASFKNHHLRMHTEGMKTDPAAADPAAAAADPAPPPQTENMRTLEGAATTIVDVPAAPDVPPLKPFAPSSVPAGPFLPAPRKRRGAAAR